jgi:myo-inositol 2-dehydrogenase/D-chiro-inositol 1-dehydrogenase
VTGDDVQCIFNDSTIDAILICSPAPSHLPLIIQAAVAGKHIFCEKPLALDIAAIQQALAVVEQAQVILQVGFNRRFDPNFAKVKHVIAEGGIGALHIIHITSRDPEPPSHDYIASSGGIFLDMSIHDFDMARFLVGSEITEVYAAGAALIDPTIAQLGDVDTAVIQLTFANGTLGIIDNSRQAVYGYDQRVEVFGSQGKMLAHNVSATQTELSTANAVTRDLPMQFFLDRYQASYLAELRSFCHAIRHKQAAAVDGQDGLMAVIIGHAAKKSCQSHQPIQMDYEHPEQHSI